MQVDDSGVSVARWLRLAGVRAWCICPAVCDVPLRRTSRVLHQLLKDLAHCVGGVEDGLAQGWRRLCVQALWGAHGDHVTVRGDGAHQAVELVDLGPVNTSEAHQH